MQCTPKANILSCRLTPYTPMCPPQQYVQIRRKLHADMCESGGLGRRQPLKYPRARPPSPQNRAAPQVTPDFPACEPPLSFQSNLQLPPQQFPDCPPLFLGPCPCREQLSQCEHKARRPRVSGLRRLAQPKARKDNQTFAYIIFRIPKGLERNSKSKLLEAQNSQQTGMLSWSMHLRRMGTQPKGSSFLSKRN